MNVTQNFFNLLFERIFVKYTHYLLFHTGFTSQLDVELFHKTLLSMISSRPILSSIGSKRNTMLNRTTLPKTALRSVPDRRTSTTNLQIDYFLIDGRHFKVIDVRRYDETLTPTQATTWWWTSCIQTLRHQHYAVLPGYLDRLKQTGSIAQNLKATLPDKGELSETVSGRQGLPTKPTKAKGLFSRLNHDQRPPECFAALRG